MKVLVSTKVLAEELSKIAETDAVQSMLLRDQTLTLYTNSQVLEIMVQPLPTVERARMLDQRNRRWDVVFSLMKAVPEQPVLLDIFEHRIDVIFQY